MASTRSGRIRFNLFAIILKIHQTIVTQADEEQYFPKIPNYNSWRPVFPRWRKSWMESHCAEKRTSKASTINFCIISFLKSVNNFERISRCLYICERPEKQEGGQTINLRQFLFPPRVLWELCSTGHFTFSFRLFYSAAAEAAAFNLERYIKQKLMNHPPTLMKFAPLFILRKQQNTKTLRFVTKVPF